MRSNISIFLSCLACAGQARRVQISLEQLLNSSHEKSEKLLETLEALPQLQSARRASAKGNRSPMNSLKGLLLKLREEDRLNTSTSKTSFPDDNASRAGLMAFSLSGMLSGQVPHGVKASVPSTSDELMRDSMLEGGPQPRVAEYLCKYANITTMRQLWSRLLEGLRAEAQGMRLPVLSFMVMIALGLLGLIGWLCSCWLLRRLWMRAKQADGVGSSAKTSRGCNTGKAGKTKTNAESKKRRAHQHVKVATEELAHKEHAGAKEVLHARQEHGANQVGPNPTIHTTADSQLGKRYNPKKEGKKFCKTLDPIKQLYTPEASAIQEQVSVGFTQEVGAPPMAASKNMGDEEPRKNCNRSAKKARRKAGRAEEKLHPIVEETDGVPLVEVSSGAADGVWLEEVGSGAADDQAVSNLEEELCAETLDLQQSAVHSDAEVAREAELANGEDQQKDVDQADGLGQGDCSTEIATASEAGFDDQVVDAEPVVVSPAQRGADGNEAAFLQLSCKERKHDVESAPTVASSSDLSSEIDGAVSVFDEDVAHDAPNQHRAAAACRDAQQPETRGAAARKSWASIVAGRRKPTSEAHGGDDEDAGHRHGATAAGHTPCFWPSLSEASNVVRPSKAAREATIAHKEDQQQARSPTSSWAKLPQQRRAGTGAWSGVSAAARTDSSAGDQQDRGSWLQECAYEEGTPSSLWPTPRAFGGKKANVGNFEDDYEYIDAQGTFELPPCPWGEGVTLASEQPRLQALAAARVLEALGCDEGDLEHLLEEEFDDEDTLSRPEDGEAPSSISMVAGPLLTDGLQVYRHCVSEDGQHFYTDGVQLYAAMCFPIETTMGATSECSAFAYKDHCDDDVWDSCWDTVLMPRSGY